MSRISNAAILAKNLDAIAEGLDVPDGRFLEVKARYEAVGAWLDAEDSKIKAYRPRIFVQGSFALGTVVKPVGEDGEYDVDLVCLLEQANKNAISQKQLKEIVGQRIKDNETYKKLLKEEGRRCWTLVYANEFHMDILPSMPDKERQGNGGIDEDAILITDLKKIAEGGMSWPKSNPIGYVKWFRERQQKVFSIVREAYARRINAKVEEVPEYKIKTPLQKAVQILKRHRDLHFEKQGEFKPISMIITTLSGMLYEGQEDSFNAIYDILNKFNKEMVMKNGQFWIPNPTNSQENFADKWNENKKLPEAFFDWHDSALQYFTEMSTKKTDDTEVREAFSDKFKYSIKGVKPNTEPIKPVYFKTSAERMTRPWMK